MVVVRQRSQQRVSQHRGNVWRLLQAVRKRVTKMPVKEPITGKVFAGQRGAFELRHQVHRRDVLFGNVPFEDIRHTGAGILADMQKVERSR